MDKMIPNQILIVGGGIAGLTLAAALVQRGQAVEIVERTPNGNQLGQVLCSTRMRLQC